MSEWRRQAVRVPVPAVPMHATWVEQWQTVQSDGEVLDLSAGGFAARMRQAPPTGRLLHAALAIDAKGIQADARVCGRSPDLVPTPQADWVVHFAFENLHPADEKRMAHAIAAYQGRH